MFDFRKALWGSALLVAFTGCNNEEPTGTNPPPPPPTVPGGGTPTPPPPTGAEKKDETPPPAKPDEKGEAKEDVKLEAPGKAAAPKDEPPPKEEAEKKAAASPSKETLSAEELAQIDKLPAADKALALAQIVCPVSGEHLGSMGAPVKKTAEGKTFFICCKGCTEDIEKDPKGVVAKLNQK